MSTFDFRQRISMVVWPGLSRKFSIRLKAAWVIWNML